jgi:hypothetical protein
MLLTPAFGKADRFYRGAAVDALKGEQGNLAEALKAQVIAEAATKSLISGQLEHVDYPALTLQHA